VTAWLYTSTDHQCQKSNHKAYDAIYTPGALAPHSAQPEGGSSGHSEKFLGDLMKTHRSHKAIARFIGTVLIAFAASAANARSDQADFENAMALYRSGKWAGAYGRFCNLADGGHSEAARIALFMLQYGTRLYGSGWTASESQINGWILLDSRNPAPLLAAGGD
jgi:hypothetical protein